MEMRSMSNAWGERDGAQSCAPHCCQNTASRFRLFATPAADHSHDGGDRGGNHADFRRTLRKQTRTPSPRRVLKPPRRWLQFAEANFEAWPRRSLDSQSGDSPQGPPLRGQMRPRPCPIAHPPAVQQSRHPPAVQQGGCAWRPMPRILEIELLLGPSCCAAKGARLRGLGGASRNNASFGNCDSLLFLRFLPIIVGPRPDPTGLLILRLPVPGPPFARAGRVGTRLARGPASPP